MSPALDCVVIGSGAGGLTAALALARRGRSVLVLEQHAHPGGFTQSFVHEGHRFSPGVHYIGELGEGGDARRIYEGLGLGPHLEFCELNPDGYDHIVVAGERFDVPAGAQRERERLVDRFPRERRGIERFFAVIDELLRGVLEIGTSFGAAGTARAVLRSPALLRWGLRTLDGLLRATIRDPLLAAILSARCGNHGLPPSRVSLAAHARMIRHYWDGAYYPRGGASSIARAMVAELQSRGGVVRLHADVARIVLADGRAAGVELTSGERILARRVISNASPAITFGKLMPPAASREGRLRLKRTEHSISTLGVFCGLDGDARALGLDSGNTWWYRARDVGALYERMARELPAGCVDGFFLNATSLKDPDPERRGHTLEAFTFVPYAPFARWADKPMGARGPDYARLKEYLGEILIDAIAEHVPGIRDAMRFRLVATPLTSDHYCRTYRGAVYGTAKTPWQVGPFGYGVRTSIRDLYLVGASTLSHGVIGAAASGLLAAREILGARSEAELLSPMDGSLRLHPAREIAASRDDRAA